MIVGATQKRAMLKSRRLRSKKSGWLQQKEETKLSRVECGYPWSQAWYTTPSRRSPLVRLRMYGHHHEAHSPLERHISRASERKMTTSSDLQQECEDGGRTYGLSGRGGVQIIS